MFFLHRPVYDEAMSTDDPYLACLYGFNDHKNYGNCSKCSQGNYCNIGIVKQSLIETDKCLKIARNIKNLLLSVPKSQKKPMKKYAKYCMVTNIKRQCRSYLICS